MAHKRDIKQFRQACKEAGIDEPNRFPASDALHAEKDAGELTDMEYRELVAWLREWKNSWRPS